ncbi:AlpA family transcriptional regulator [Magnetovirga frankeli]|uniref:helix-turn-helix transcriptional regulator n=1 Tax=Magnetovirga frankeli TaxID=947516 RepID=UPI00129408A2|nr:AlpA family transcriptional regulator [gamma proteobacterium SS-5]
MIYKQNEKYGSTYRLLRIGRVSDLTGISKSYIYHLCNQGLFPKPVPLVPGGSSVAWLESEVLAWIDQRVQARDCAIGDSNG